MIFSQLFLFLRFFFGQIFPPGEEKTHGELRPSSKDMVEVLKHDLHTGWAFGVKVGSDPLHSNEKLDG